MSRTISHQLRIALVEDNPDFALQRQLGKAQKRRVVIDDSCWIIGTIDDDDLGGGSDGLFNKMCGQFVSGLASIDIHWLGAASSTWAGNVPQYGCGIMTSSPGLQSTMAAL